MHRACYSLQAWARARADRRGRITRRQGYQVERELGQAPKQGCADAVSSRPAPRGATRFPPIEPTAMTDAQRRLADDITSGPRGDLAGPFTALLRTPAIGTRFQMLGEEIRFRSTIAPALKELAVLLTARRWTSHFEWHMHRQMALDAGLSRALVDSIARGDAAPPMAPDEETVHRFCTELLESGWVSDRTFGQARSLLGDGGVVELVCTVGYYSLVAFVVNVDRQPVPADGFTLDA